MLGCVPVPEPDHAMSVTSLQSLQSLHRFLRACYRFASHTVKRMTAQASDRSFHSRCFMAAAEEEFSWSGF